MDSGNTGAQPLEEVAGDVMQQLLELAGRLVKHERGEAQALALMDLVEAGRARLAASVDVGGSDTRMSFALHLPGQPRQELAAFMLLRVTLPH